MTPIRTARTRQFALLAAFVTLTLFAVSCGGSSESSSADDVDTSADADAAMEDDAENDESAPAEEDPQTVATEAPPEPTDAPPPPTEAPEPTAEPVNEDPPAEEEPAEDPPAEEEPAQDPPAAEAPADEAPEPATEPEADVVADLDNGAALYAASCARCHGDTGTGTRQGRPLVGISAEASVDVHAGSVLNGKGNMPAFADSLNPDEVNDIIAFVYTL